MSLQPVNRYAHTFETPLQQVRREDWDRDVELLLARGADFNSPLPPKTRRTALQAECEKDHKPIACRLLQSGTRVDTLVICQRDGALCNAMTCPVHLARVLMDAGAACLLYQVWVFLT